MTKQDINNLQESILQSHSHINIEKKQQDFLNLKTISESETFWQNQEDAKKILLDMKKLENVISPWQTLLDKVTNLKELFELMMSEGDLELQKELENDFAKFSGEFEKLTTSLLLKNEEDVLSAYITIHSGAGGTESCDWASMLFRMYSRYCEKNNYKVSVVDLQEGTDAGIKSVTLKAEGENVYGYLKGETGVHRLVRISPFDANKKRHTSFASVFISPVVNENIDIVIDEADLKIDTYRSSGKGGQSVNTTDSAIRITHIPTGIVVTCQNERSQLKNREMAMSILKSRMYEMELEKKKNAQQQIENQKSDISWGNQIRSYTFQPYMLVKDTRTGHEEFNVPAVMDGEIENFLIAYLKTL